MTHDTVLLDVDGTLIDSTYHHAIAWHRAFGDYGIDLPMWRCLLYTSPSPRD